MGPARPFELYGGSLPGDACFAKSHMGSYAGLHARAHKESGSFFAHSKTERRAQPAALTSYLQRGNYHFSGVYRRRGRTARR